MSYIYMLFDKRNDGSFKWTGSAYFDEKRAFEYAKKSNNTVLKYAINTPIQNLSLSPQIPLIENLKYGVFKTFYAYFGNKFELPYYVTDSEKDMKEFLDNICPNNSDPRMPCISFIIQ